MRRVLLVLLGLAVAGCDGADVTGGQPADPPDPNDPVTEECEVDAECDDFDACNGDEVCSGGSCVDGWATSCDDGDPCTDDVCDPGTGACASTRTAICDAQDCSLLEPGVEVDDGAACNGVDVCGDGGEVVPGTPVSCDDFDPCTTDECLEPTGSCFHADVANCDVEPLDEEGVGGSIERDCEDDLDDDEDGWTDCDDDDCWEKPACTGGEGEGEEEEEDDVEVCDDRVDNDGDLAIDCYDRDCLGEDPC